MCSKIFSILKITLVIFLGVATQTQSQCQEKQKSVDRQFQFIEDIYDLLGPDEFIIHIQTMGGGFANNLWLVETQSDKYVLRSPQKREHADDFDRCLRIAENASQAGLAPLIYAVNIEKQQMLLEYVCSNNWPAYEDDCQPYWDTMKVLKDFHQLLSPLTSPWKTEKDSLFSFIFQQGNELVLNNQVPIHFLVALQRCQRISSAIQPWLREQSTLCHGDFHKNNVLLKPQNGSIQPMLIDFDSAVWGHPFADIAKFSLGLDPKSRLEILEAYLERELTVFDQSHFELMDLALLMFVAIKRYHAAIASFETSSTEWLEKEELEALLDHPELLPSFLSLSFGDGSPKTRQLGAIYALGEFLRRTEGETFEANLKAENTITPQRHRATEKSL